MNAVRVKDALSSAQILETEIEVNGWVRTRRDSKAGISFVAVSDGSCRDTIQLVAGSSLPNYASEILTLTAGCAVSARGKLVASQGKGQAREIQVTSLRVVGTVVDPDSYPMQAKAHSAEFLREQAHLRPRTNVFGAIARIRQGAALSIHKFFASEGFLWVNTPIITASDAEGAGHLFRVSTLDADAPPRDAQGRVDTGKDFFGTAAYLTVSGQLNVEAYCLALSKVYTFGPTFRAENSNTTRHLAEFWMVEPEIAFADLQDDANLAERFVRRVAGDLVAEHLADLQVCEEAAGKGVVAQGGLVARLSALAESPFERLTYTEAIGILQKADRAFTFAPEWGKDLQTEHERFLTEVHFGAPLIVMDYPAEFKAFYMRLNSDGRTVAAMDVLAPGIGEIIGGSQREERLDVLEQRMAAQGLPTAPYDWYLDLRRYGSVPHAGFGLGFERLLAYVCGLNNIRDAVPFPRAPGWARF